MRGIPALLVLVSVFLALPASVAAPAAPGAATIEGGRVEAVEAGRGAEVRVGGRPLFTLEAPAGGSSSYERAVTVARRLGEALSAGYLLDEMRVARAGSLLVICLGGRPILTVTAADARAAGVGDAELAIAWAEHALEAAGLDPSELAYDLGEAPPARLAADRQVLDPEARAEKVVPVYYADGRLGGRGSVRGAAGDVGLVRAITLRKLPCGEAALPDCATPVRSTPGARRPRRVYGVQVIRVELTSADRSDLVLRPTGAPEGGEDRDD